MKRQTVIQVENLSYAYPGRPSAPVLRAICFSVAAGERVAILGANGSGKSTLLSCLNGLAVPENEGNPVTIYAEDGRALSPARKEDIGEIRRRIGTVTQNPDDQIVSSVVEEDVAFGPENLGLSKSRTADRVEASLKSCGIEALRTRSVRFLSGGEKQRLALAGVLALETGVIALDEAVSMIDPAGREAFLALLDTLNAEGKTLLQVTHSLEEAFRCERCLVLYRGGLVFDGKPGDLLARPELESWGFVLSEPLAAIRLLSEKFPGFSVSTLNPDEAAEQIAVYMKGGTLPRSPSGRAPPGSAPAAHPPPDSSGPEAAPGGPAAIRCVHAFHEYREDGPDSAKGSGSSPRSGETRAFRGMRDVHFTLPAGKSLAVIGTSGSGKSTLLKHLNALLLPRRGRVFVMEKDTLDKKNKLAELRMRAALSIQSPESALFEEYVADDVAFGPANTGLSGTALKGRVVEAMEAAGLPFGDFADRKTFSLSGGEKRRAAIAGVVAMDSPVLLFDEPLAGLDGVRRRRVLSMIDGLKSRGKTVVVTTHSMECAASFDIVAVMADGTVAAFGPPREIFGPRWNSAWGLSLPWPAAVARRLASAGLVPRDPAPLDAAELADMAAGGMEPGGAARDAADSSPDFRRESPACDSDGGPDRREGGQAEEPEKARKRTRRKTGTEFFRTAGLGHFLDRPSPLRFLSGRIKLPLFIAAAAAAIVPPSPFFPSAVLVLGLAAGAAAGRVGPGRLLRGFVSLLPWLVVMALIQQLYINTGSGGVPASAAAPDSIVRFWKFSVGSASLLRSASLFVRVASLTVLVSLYSAVTPLRETLDAFNAGLSVLGPLGFPSRDVSLGAGIALRFVPVLSEEAERIVVAQLSRGGKKGRPGMVFSMIAPLFLRSLERSEKLAQAIALRLYGYTKHR
ncbi:MAG: ATP-binding cassette domain-containing protein [Treponema sp.]|nr:ATP-binding cassette domain-containing protein [Treponema sp.]